MKNQLRKFLRSRLVGFLIGLIAAAPITALAGISLTSAGGVTVGGAVTGGTNNTVLYITNTGTLGSEAAFGYNESTNLEIVDNLTVATALKNTALTSGRVIFAGASGLFVDDAEFLYDTTSDILTLGTAGAGTNRFIWNKTMSGSSTTSNFGNLTGTLPATLSAAAHAVFINITGAGSSAQNPSALTSALNAGYTGAQASYAGRFTNVSAGTGTNIAGSSSFTANAGADATAAASTAGSLVGFRAGASQTGSGRAAGIVGFAIHTNSGSSTSGYFPMSTFYGSTNNSAIYALAAATSGPIDAPTFPTGSLVVFDNGATTLNPFVARDNGAAVPTTGATATVAVRDGAQLQLGNTVLTTATATAEIQGQGRTSTHSYTITTAMFNTALGAGTTGDVAMATLPAKTVVLNAYYVVTEITAGPSTATVSCGRVAAGYIDYIVASDVKVAANTVYGDGAAERGTNLTGYDLPAYASTTSVVCQMLTGDAVDLTTGQGRLVLTTMLAP